APADAAFPETAVGAALCARRLAHRRRPVIDRRRRGRNRGRQRRRRLRTCLPNCGIRLSSQHTPHVCGAVAAVACRDCHLRPAGANLAFAAKALARKRTWKRKLKVVEICPTRSTW